MYSLIKFKKSNLKFIKIKNKINGKINQCLLDLFDLVAFCFRWNHFFLLASESTDSTESTESTKLKESIIFIFGFGFGFGFESGVYFL